MKKIFFTIIFSFFFCLLLNLSGIWLFFTPFYFMMEGRKISENAMWEIPMAALVIAIAVSFLTEYEGIFLRSLILLAAGVISAISPKKLFVFFPAVIFSLFIDPRSGIAIIFACLWCGIRQVFLRKDKRYHYSRNNNQSA